MTSTDYIDSTADSVAASCSSVVTSQYPVADIVRHMLLCQGVQIALVEWRDGTGVDMDAELSKAWRTIMSRTERQYVNARVVCDRIGAGDAIRAAGL